MPGKPAAVIAIALSMMAALNARPKTDIVTMKNGDRYTCEIVSLSQGQLNVKTVNTAGTVPLDWLKVDRIESTQFFAVELSDGSYLAGTISKVPDKDTINDFLVTLNGHTTAVSGAAVVMIARSGIKLLGRLSGSVSAGVNYTKGNDTRQYNVNADLTARARNHEFNPSVSSTFSGQSGGTSTSRNDVNIQYWRGVSENWLIGSYNDFLQSDEQQLDLRATFGGFAGRHLVRTNRTTLMATAGAVFTSEHYSDSLGGASRQKNAEGMVGARFSMFRFDSTNLAAQMRVFPSMSTPGRVRIDTDIMGKLDLTHSVNLTISFFSNFDSQPPVHVPRSDQGVNLGFGWSF